MQWCHVNLSEPHHSVNPTWGLQTYLSLILESVGSVGTVGCRRRIDFRKVNAAVTTNLTVVQFLVWRTALIRWEVKGYWQVPPTAKAKKIPSFSTWRGLISFSVVPFGWRNPPAAFQRLMNRVLAGLTGCAACLDDVVFSDTWRAHVPRLNAVIECITAYRLPDLYLLECFVMHQK